LTKAQSIFEQKGMLKLLKEVKQKLKLLQPGGKFNQMVNDPNFANILTGVDSDEDLGDVASPETMAGRGKSKGAAAKKKKKPSAGSGLGQRKVINNYVGN
jgi:hypothetical protein